MSGVTLIKATTTIGTPDGGAGIDESQRLRLVNRDADTVDACAAGT